MSDGGNGQPAETPPPPPVPPVPPPVPAVPARERLARALIAVPAGRAAPTQKPATQAFERPPSLPSSSSSAPAPAVSPLAAPSAGRAGYLAVKGRLHERLLDEINRDGLLGASEERLAGHVRDFVRRMLEGGELPLNEAERGRLADDLLEETLGVGPLAPLMADPAVTDILVNGPQAVYVERYGRLARTDVQFRDADHLVRIIQRIATGIGRRIDESSPMVDARLPDGSRVNATLPPATIDGPTLSIRRFGRQRLRRDDLQRLGMLSADMVAFLQAAVVGRRNVLISGGTGAGKSTLLGAVAEAIPHGERVVTIEDAAELILDQEHVVRMETRPANVEGRGRITTRDLVVNSLRMRPDRIVVGEVRGPEALDMLQAMNTGHDGSLTTVHANSPRDAVARLETMVLMAGIELPSRAIREQIASAIHLLVHVRRYEDGVRRVESIAEVTGLEGVTLQTQDLFKFERRGMRGRSVAGEFVATNIVPRMYEELRARGIELPIAVFQRASSSPSSAASGSGGAPARRGGQDDA